MRVFYTDVVAIIDEGVGNSTLSLALDEIISEGMVKVQKTGEPRSVVFYDDEDGKQHAYISNLSGRALFSHFEKTSKKSAKIGLFNFCVEKIY